MTGSVDMDFVATLFAIWFFGFGVGYLACDHLTRRRRKALSNWEPGMTITTADGEKLYVCAVERETDT